MVPQPSHSPFQKQALIVLPDPALRNLVSDLLLRRNYRVSAVGSLKDGVEAFQHQSLIITTPQADASLREGMIAWVREQTPPSVEQPYVLALGERDQAQLTTEANRDWDELITLPLNPLHFNARLEAIENWIAVRSVEPSMTDSKPRSSLSGAKATQPPTTSPKATASFQALLDGNPKPMAVFDSNLRYLAVNERWKREFHLEEELLPGKKHSDYFPDLSDVWYSACRDALRGKKKNCEEDSWLQSNGKRTKLAWSLEPWSDTSGEVSGLLITCTPQQKQAAPSRSASPSSHLIGQAFLSNESIPFLLLDLDGKILESNSAAASFSSTGFAPDKNSLFWDIYCHKEMRQDARRQFTEWARRKPKKNASFPFPPTWSLPCTPLQGNTVDILWSLLPFRDESGAVTGLLCSGAPSTASQAVALTPLTSPSSSRYRPLLEAIPYGVILLDDQGQVTYENGGLTLLSGHQITPFTSITDWLRKVLGEAESTEATITAWCTSLLERKETVSLTITAADQTSLPLLFEPSQVEGRGVVVTVSEDRTTLEVPGEMNDHTARLFFQRTGFAIAVEDSHGHLIEANPACQALTRQPAEVIAQVGLKKLLHPEDQIAVEARIAQVRKAPSFTYDPMDVRLRQPSSDGEDVFQKVCLQISGIPNPNGHLLYLAYLLSRPVDEGQHLPRNRELLLDSLPDLLILADRSGDVLDAIPSASGFLFPSTEPLMGQRLARLLPSLGDPESVHHWIRSAAEQGAAQSKTFRDPVTGKPLEARLSDAGAGRVILSVREKQAQAASVSDHRHIAFQRIADAVVVADHTGQIIDWNPAATDLFGSTRDSMLGRSLSTIFSPQDPVSFNHQLADALSYQGEWSGTAEFIRGDGSPGTCEVHYAAATIEESDHPVIIGINRRPQSPPESPKTEKVDSELWDSLKLLGTLSGLDFRQAATHDLRQSLRKNSSRLQTIAFAHQSLEKMESGAVLNLSHFLQKISTQVFQSHVESDQEVNLQLQCPELLVPVSSAIPFGLVLEEWLQDILPQVRQNEASSALTISVQLTDTELELRIETPGAPLVLDQGPSPDVLQSSLTQFLATQLQAEISPLPDSGNSIALRVPIVSDAAETA